jgi:hypothetical protein
MFKRAVLLLSALSISVTLSANEDLRDIYNTGSDASMKLLKTLGMNLKKEMKANGPMGAIKFCTEKAFPLTDRVNSELPEGVSVKRVSSEYRNPINSPLPDEEKILKAIEESFQVTPKGILQQTGDNEFKFYKPLKIGKPVCLKCHGSKQQIPAPIQSYLKEVYPLDNATDHKMGDLRGAIVVTIKRAIQQHSEEEHTHEDETHEVHDHK